MGTTLNSLKLLDYFTIAKPELGLSQVVRQTNMNKATVLRHLKELCEYGLLEQSPTTKLYSIGPVALRLAGVREATKPVLVAAHQIMKEQAVITRESLHLSLLNGNELQNAAVEESRFHSVRVTFIPSEILPIHATASGAIMLAFGPETLKEHLKNQILPSYSDSTITDPSQILRYAQKVQTSGWAESPGAREAGVHGFSAPVFGPDQIAIGAIACAVPQSRVTPSLRTEILQSLQIASRDITVAFGGLTPAAYPKQFNETLNMLPSNAGSEMETEI
ncbi:IclR family transcriptional regulator [Cochlodiniinecator piscidefendens]|uniref:IclR family transcriptional regulator n=1 Tax=Cochlodiniinecator piscidefendens TaxID=2715756 RepID=UPI0014083C92|nr:IclR family transcriptional regulator [Cochlodiniinecator piscidefendens]